MKLPPGAGRPPVVGVPPSARFQGMTGGYGMAMSGMAMNAQVISLNYGFQRAEEARTRADELAEEFATDRGAAKEFVDEYNERNRDWWSQVTWGFGDHRFKSGELSRELLDRVKAMYPDLFVQRIEEPEAPPLTPEEIERLPDPAVYRAPVGKEGVGLDQTLLLRDPKPTVVAPEGEPAPGAESRDERPPRTGVRQYGRELRHGAGSGGRMPHEGWRSDDAPRYGNRDEDERDGSSQRREGNMLHEGGGRGPSGPPSGGAPSGSAPAPSAPPSGGGGQPSPGNAGGPPASGGSGPAPDPGRGQLKRLERGPEGRSGNASPDVRV